MCVAARSRRRSGGHLYRLHASCIRFFFQAEDGIRDLTVTGVQTCALPISLTVLSHPAVVMRPLAMPYSPSSPAGGITADLVDVGLARPEDVRAKALGGKIALRSEERRVGKEGRSRWAPDH